MKKTIALLVILYCSLLFSFGTLLHYASGAELRQESVTSQQAINSHQFIFSAYETCNYLSHIADSLKIKLDGLNSNNFKHNSLSLFEKVSENFFPVLSAELLFLIYNNLRI